jgi:Cu/Zn superoxide dismutase
MRWINRTNTWVSVFGFCVLSGCAGGQKATPEAEAAEAPPKPQSYERGVARMYPRSSSEVKGGLVFRDTPEGLQVTGDLENLEAGSSYAVYLHSKPDCSALDAKSVGPIYNPGDGSPPAGLLGQAHGTADGEGKEVDLLVPHLKLNGSDSIVDLAVVVHAWPFDPEAEVEKVPYLSCGVIEGD